MTINPRCFALIAAAALATQAAAQTFLQPGDLSETNLPSLRLIKEGLQVSKEHHAVIGQHVRLNYTGGKYELLTYWSKDDAYPMLGIANFLWYPAGYRGKFSDDFPSVQAALQAEGVALPDWLKPGRPAPWPDREAFIAKFHSEEMEQLRQMLASTVEIQTRVLIARAERSFSAMLDVLPQEERPAIREEFERVAATTVGVYALVDYVHFKGEGAIADADKRKGSRGLLRVLEVMSRGPHSAVANEDFADAAIQVLIPPDATPSNWHSIWRRHVDTYRASDLYQLLELRQAALASTTP